MSTRVVLSPPPKKAVTRRRRQRRDPRRWIMTVILLSLLAHLLFVLTLILVNRFVPKPKLKDQNAPLSVTTLSLQPPPPATPPPSPKHVFMPTDEDAGAVHKNTLIESDHDTRLRSHSTTARDSSAVMPDVTSKVRHPAELKNAPNTPTQQPPHPATPSPQTNPSPHPAPATPQTSPQPTPHPASAHQPTPPSPNPQQTQTQPQTAPQTTPKPAPAQQYDPNGLPVLPALNAPTIAQANPRQTQLVTPAASLPSTAEDSHGALGLEGVSVESRASALGKYMAKFHAAVGTYWYPKVDAHFSTLSVGVVRIQFTIHSDGRIDTKVIDGDTPALESLEAISVNAIRSASPCDPFPPELQKEVGDSYTDVFSFSIYGE